MEVPMDVSILLARFIGPFIILIGVGVVFNVRGYWQIMEDFLKNTALVYVTGLVTFVAGLAIVLSHNIWEADWRAIITVFGWITLVKGAWLTILPNLTTKMTGIFTRNIRLMAVPWSVMLIIGIFLTMKGYR